MRPGPARSRASRFDNVAYTYAGVRPLSFEEGARASKVSREHKVVAEGPDGRFLSVTGTKLTCFRSLAEEVGDRVMRALGRRAPRPHGARSRLDGARRGGGQGRSAGVDGRVGGDGGDRALGRETLQTLVETYGRGYPRVLELAQKLPDGTERLCPSNPEIVAQLHHAVRRAGRLAPGRAPAPHRHRPEPLPGPRLRGVHRRAAWPSSLGWSPRRLDAELDAYRSTSTGACASGERGMIRAL